MTTNFQDVIKALRTLADALEQVIIPDREEAEPGPPPVEVAPAPAKPGVEGKLKLEDVRAVLSDISRSGKTKEMRDLLHKYGATKLSEIDPAKYEALLAEAEVIRDA